MKGSMLLKVISIIMIVFAGISLIILLASSALFAAFGIGALVLLLLTSFALVALQLVAGILGVKNSNNPEKANICVIFGGVILALRVLDGIVSMVSPYASLNFFFFLLGLVIPVLYLVGALQLKNMTAIAPPTPPQDFVQ